MSKFSSALKLNSLIILLVMFSGNEILGQSTVTTGTLSINLSGFSDNLGQAIVFLYRKDDKIPSVPFLQISGPIKNHESVILIKEIPFGDYAIIVSHDKNSNGIIDHKWGFPAEPLGYSNNWEFTLFSGMPNFEKLRFTFSDSKRSCQIQLGK